MTNTTLIFGVLYSSIGVGLFVYGKKQSKYIPLLSGVLLMLLPLLITNPIGLILVGALLLALPYFIRM